MIFAALIRYVASDSVRAERWVAPVVLFLILTVSGTAVGGTALGSYGFTVTALFPIAIWLTIMVLNSEDPIQTAITTAAVGGRFTVRSAKLCVAYLACQVPTLIGVAWPLLTGHPAGPRDVAAGVLGHLLSSLAGVAVGSILSRPVMQKPSWAVVLGITAFLVEILVPGFPPVRPLAVLFSDTPGASASLWGLLTLVTVETLVGVVVLVGLGHLVARRRT